MNVTEEWMYHIWQTRNFNHSKLSTVKGEAIEILNYGTRNLSSGPDFIQAAIKIGNLVWYGHVEMHVITSDWHRHGHEADGAYENVILHVVWHHDHDPTEGKVPVLELAPLTEKSLWNSYQKLLTATIWLPCLKLLNGKCLERYQLWRHRLVIERWERKAALIKTELALADPPDWDNMMYQLIAMYLFDKENRANGLQLAQRLPLIIIERNRHQPLAVLAMLVGVSGLLEDIHDENFRQLLAREFAFLKNKYGLKPMKAAVWRKFGMYAGAMPLRRLSQLAALLSVKTRFFNEMLACKTTDALNRIWPDTMPEHPTWKKLLPSHSLMTRAVKDRLNINVVVPAWILYHKSYSSGQHPDFLIEILEFLPPEKNSLCEKYGRLGFPAASAFDCQAIMELNERYCRPGKCISCAVGQHIFTGKE